ncbi:MAG TPA: site-specific integrase [Pelobium sp.]|nr:site-specific integrase [Pelobium sp.]
MLTSFQVLFYLKKPKSYSSGQMPIYLRISVNGKRSEISIGRSCSPSNWNPHSGRSKGNKEDVKLLNAYLESLHTKLNIAHQVLVESGKELTVEYLRNAISGKREKSKMLLEIFDDHNQKVEALLGSGFEPNTLKGYRTTVKHLKSFIKYKYKNDDIPINKLNHEFIVDFEFYLRSSCKISMVSAAKYIKNLKKIVNSCVAHDWIIKNPFVNYKSKAKAGERVYLTQNELNSIYQKQFTIERLAQVKDIFLFCCYTGLAYADIKKLRRQEIGLGIDGGFWIFTKRKKTNTSTRVPLLDIAVEILDKYKDHPHCEAEGTLLPVLSNQKMNSYLKEIADLCSITKTLTFHIARHTFATTVTLSNGVPIETVSKMLGHTNIKTTQHYAKILDVKVSNDMSALRSKVSFK